MSESSSPCIFCAPPAERVLLSSPLAYALADGFPATPMHALVIPKRHAEHYFVLTPDEVMACHELVRELREVLTQQDASITGFNIGVNVGEASGQTIFHCHFHLIPRRHGDVPSPRGGVRNVIPGKGNY